MKQVYLIRHGLPEFPGGQRRCIGSTDLLLSPEGAAQAAEMARTLPTVTAVFSSPLTRAMQTAQAITPDFIIVENLREQDYGQWEGLAFPEIKQKFPALYAARAKDLSLLPPGAEDSQSALARFSDALEQAARQSPGDLAVVAHGGIIALFLESLTGKWYKPNYCEIVTVNWDECGFYHQEVSSCGKC